MTAIAVKYLVRRRKPKVAHIFLGVDTACRMYSTGGLKKRLYKVVDDPGELPICENCQRKFEQFFDQPFVMGALHE